ncbi:DMT family transporter [Desulfovibrionales bacterium]
MPIQQKKAYALGMTAVCFWSTAASAFKLTLRHMHPESMVFYASLTSVLVLGLLLGIQGTWSSLRTLTWRTIRLSLLLGMLNPALYYLVLLKAYALLRAQDAQVINYTWAIAMTVLAVPLLGQRIRPMHMLAIGLSYFGTLIICTRGNVLDMQIDSPLGFTLALASTIIWAIFWILGMRDSLDPLVRLFLNFCFGTVGAFFWLILSSGLTWPSWPGLAGCVYIGTFEMGLTFVLWIQALKLSRTAAQISTLIYLAPFLSLIFIHYVLGEVISPSTLFGLVCILVGMAAQNLTDHAQAQPSRS